MDSLKPSYKIPKCPKCGGIPSSYSESRIVTWSWSATEEGTFVYEMLNYSNEKWGDIIRYECTCKECSHTWTLRKMKDPSEMMEKFSKPEDIPESLKEE